jgi:hypothetical protein
LDAEDLLIGLFWLKTYPTWEVAVSVLQKSKNTVRKKISHAVKSIGGIEIERRIG